MKEFALDMVIGLGWLLALARLTRLIVKDEITDFIRQWIFGRFGEHSMLGYLFVCPWCMSIWLALITAPYLIWLTGAGWECYPVMVLAGSYVVGLAAENLEADDDDIEIEIDDETD